MADRRFGLLDGSWLGQRLASCESHDVLDIFSASHNGVGRPKDVPAMIAVMEKARRRC